MRDTVVVLTKLPGQLPVKTRLLPVLGEEGVRGQVVRWLRDVVALARTVDPEPVVAYSPPDADPGAALPGVSGCVFRPVAGADGATCLENALRDAYRGAPLVALGNDAPDLPADRLAGAVRALETRDAVFVPTGDGGFSLLGLRRPVDGLAGGFRYGERESLAALRGFFEGRGLSVAELDPWPDIDTPADLEAYRGRLRAP